jgi:hypothetical protein
MCRVARRDQSRKEALHNTKEANQRYLEAFPEEKEVIQLKEVKDDNLEELLDKEPRRTGKPDNPSPAEMKSIWNE